MECNKYIKWNLISQKFIIINSELPYLMKLRNSFNKNY